MIALDSDDVERLRALLTACLDGSQQVGAVRVLDPALGKRRYLGDIAAELLTALEERAA